MRPIRTLVTLLTAFALVATLCRPAIAADPHAAPSPRPVDGMAGQVSTTDVATDRSASGARCADYYFPVTLAADTTDVYRVWGRLCAKASFTHRTVQLLMHGGTYDHNYWDWPQRSRQYSYVRAATDAGFVTLTIDRPGAGYSDYPPAERLTVDAQAWVAHQLVQYLRKGSLGHAYRKVILVGHSMGSYAAFTEAGRFGDVDGVLLSGSAHSRNQAVSDALRAAMHPAGSDPKFAGRNLPAGYNTSKPGLRCQAFYYGPGVDPAVCARDEELKSTVSGVEQGSIPATVTDPAPENQITVPVLVALGNYDLLFCTTPTCGQADSPARAERQVFPKARSFQLFFQPAAGHDMNLHRTAPVWYAVAILWAVTKVGVR